MMDMLRGTVTPKDWMAVGVILCITLALCAGFYLLVYEGKTQQLSEAEAQRDTLQASYDEAVAQSKKMEQLQADKDEIQSLVEEFETRLPDQAEIALLLSQFEQLAGEVGVDVELKSERRYRDGRKETIPYAIVARGSFHQLANFINRLEFYERFLKVSDLEIDEEEARVSEATFTLSTFAFVKADTGGAS